MLSEVKKIIENNFKISILVSSIFISLLFLLVKNQVITHINVETSTHLGQMDRRGMYDFGDYTLQVNNLVEYNSFKRNGEILNRYPPVYPIMLYGAYHIARILHIDLEIVVVAMSIFFNLLSAIFLARILWVFSKNKILAFTTCILFISHPYVLQGLTKSMSVTPFMSFFYGSLYLLFLLLLNPGHKSFIRLFGMGILLGVTMLIRPIGIILPLLYIFIYSVICFNSQKLKVLAHSLIILIGAGIIVAPWQFYNSTNGQLILLADNSVKSIKHGITFNNSPVKDHINLPKDVDQLAKRLSTNNFETTGEFNRMLNDEFRRNPKSVIKLFIIKASRAWYGTFGQEKEKEKIKLLISLIYIILAITGSTGYIMKRPQYKFLILSIVVLLLYFWGMTILVASIVRYMIPVFGLMCLVIPGISYIRIQKDSNNIN